MKKKIWQPIAAAAAVAAICFGSVAVSKGSPSEEASTPSVTPTQLKTAPPLSGDLHFVPDIRAEEQAARSYVRSPERIRQFESDFAKASVLIASGLDSGWFSDTTFRYDADKQARQQGYTGWGGIATLDQSWFAGMTWHSTGRIDYKAGVTEFTVTAGDTVLSIASTDSGDNGPYHVLLFDGEGHKHFTSTQFWLDALIWDGDKFWPTRTLDELKWLDERAIKVLNTAMTAQFGENWRNARLVSTGPNMVYMTYLP